MNIPQDMMEKELGEYVIAYLDLYFPTPDDNNIIIADRDKLFVVDKESGDTIYEYKFPEEDNI